MSAAVTEILRDAYMGRLTSIRTLQLLAGMDNLTAAKRCCVSPHTFRRWRSDRRPNPTAMRLLAIEAGYVPGTGWHGWEVHPGDFLDIALVAESDGIGEDRVPHNRVIAARTMAGAHLRAHRARLTVESHESAPGI